MPDDAPSRPCFNVTALLKARKFPLKWSKGKVEPLLQCDRAFEGAEMIDQEGGEL